VSSFSKKLCGFDPVTNQLIKVLLSYNTENIYTYNKAVKKVGCFVQEILYTCTSISRGGEFLGFHSNPQLLMLEIFDIFSWTMTNAVLYMFHICNLKTNNNNMTIQTIFICYCPGLSLDPMREVYTQWHRSCYCYIGNHVGHQYM
jgi:hypothetical protein